MTSDYGDFDESWTDSLPPSRVDDPGARVWLLVAGTVAVAVAALLIVPKGVVALGVGYVLAAPVTFTLVALFRRWRAERYLRVGVVGSVAHLRWANALLLAGVVVAVAQAARIGIAIA